MSVCAVMLVRDEADIIEFTVRHLLAQEIDEVIVADNRSTDGTHDILTDLARTLPVVVRDDPDVGYWQSRKTTALAREAMERGHSWVLPCDADEFWYTNGRTVRALLDGLAPDVQIVSAPLFNHIPSALDDTDVRDPFVRIGWRKREHGVLPKVCCRARPDLVIDAGNHSASTDGTALTSGGLIVRHYSWRSPEQYVRKIRNGSEAYAATNLPEQIGNHWRVWDDASDETIADHYHRWFFSADPYADDSMIFDPAPQP